MLKFWFVLAGKSKKIKRTTKVSATRLGSHSKVKKKSMKGNATSTVSKATETGKTNAMKMLAKKKSPKKKSKNLSSEEQFQKDLEEAIRWFTQPQADDPPKPQKIKSQSAKKKTETVVGKTVASTISAKKNNAKTSTCLKAPQKQSKKSPVVGLKKKKKKKKRDHVKSLLSPGVVSRPGVSATANEANLLKPMAAEKKGQNKNTAGTLQKANGPSSTLQMSDTETKVTNKKCSNVSEKASNDISGQSLLNGEPEPKTEETLVPKSEVVSPSDTHVTLSSANPELQPSKTLPIVSSLSMHVPARSPEHERHGSDSQEDSMSVRNSVVRNLNASLQQEQSSQESDKNNNKPDGGESLMFSPVKEQNTVKSPLTFHLSRYMPVMRPTFSFGATAVARNLGSTSPDTGTTSTFSFLPNYGNEPQIGDGLGSLRRHKSKKKKKESDKAKGPPSVLVADDNQGDSELGAVGHSGFWQKGDSENTTGKRDNPELVTNEKTADSRSKDKSKTSQSVEHRDNVAENDDEVSQKKHKKKKRKHKEDHSESVPQPKEGERAIVSELNEGIDDLLDRREDLYDGPEEIAGAQSDSRKHKKHKKKKKKHREEDGESVSQPQEDVQRDANVDLNELGPNWIPTVADLQNLGNEQEVDEVQSGARKHKKHKNKKRKDHDEANSDNDASTKDDVANQRCKNNADQNQNDREMRTEVDGEKDLGTDQSRRHKKKKRKEKERNAEASMDGADHPEENDDNQQVPSNAQETEPNSNELDAAPAETDQEPNPERKRKKKKKNKDREKDFDNSVDNGSADAKTVEEEEERHEEDAVDQEETQDNERREYVTEVAQEPEKEKKKSKKKKKNKDKEKTPASVEQDSLDAQTCAGETSKDEERDEKTKPEPVDVGGVNVVPEQEEGNQCQEPTEVAPEVVTGAPSNHSVDDETPETAKPEKRKKKKKAKDRNRNIKTQPEEELNLNHFVPDSVPSCDDLDSEMIERNENHKKRKRKQKHGDSVSLDREIGVTAEPKKEVDSQNGDGQTQMQESTKKTTSSASEVDANRCEDTMLEEGNPGKGNCSKRNFFLLSVIHENNRNMFVEQGLISSSLIALFEQVFAGGCQPFQALVCIRQV